MARGVPLPKFRLLRSDRIRKRNREEEGSDSGRSALLARSPDNRAMSPQSWRSFRLDAARRCAPRFAPPPARRPTGAHTARDTDMASPGSAHSRHPLRVAHTAARRERRGAASAASRYGPEYQLRKVSSATPSAGLLRTRRMWLRCPCNISWAVFKAPSSQRLRCGPRWDTGASRGRHYRVSAHPVW